MTKVTIDRELLERANSLLCSYSSTLTDRAVTRRAISEICAILAAPRQQEGEGLEVVAWQDAENPLYTTAERRVLHDWVINGYPIVELCRLSDHQRAIAELREECERLRDDLEHAEHWRTLALQFDGQRMQAMALIRLAAKGETTTEHLAEFAAAPPMQASELIAERDTLRQQLAERDATIERLEAGIPRLQEHAHQMRHQRDKLAGLLREVMPDYAAPQGKGHLYAEVEAALAEVKPCQESPAPTT